MNLKFPFKLFLCYLFLLQTPRLISQKTFYGETPVKWENYEKIEATADTALYSTSDLVVLNDETEFAFYASNNEKISRNISIKINTEKGLEQLKIYRLPESFDQAYDANYYKQGRASRIKTPFIKEFEVKKFAARKCRRNRWSDVEFKINYEKIRWIRNSGNQAGEFMNEDLNVFNLQDLAVGDVVQIVYEASFNSNYGNNHFYLQSAYPKLRCQYTFIYKINRFFSGYAFVLPINIHDSLITRENKSFNDYDIVTDKIKMHNIKAINYPANSFEGNTLPHLFADFRVYRKLSGSYPSDGGRIYDFEFFRPRNFEWLVFSDTTNYYTRIYDKQSAAIHKFVGKMPPLGSDSANRIFFKALCDTFNSFRYLSSNQIFYKESNLNGLSSGDHLLKRRLVEHLQWKLYVDILNDSKIFYSVVNVQDKRFGEHNLKYRASYAYEGELIAIPVKDSYIYFMPRYNGVKYHLNELPFYYEGVLAALNPKNFQAEVKNKNDQFFKFIKTHRGTFNENTRIENAGMNISLDSSKINLSIKQLLSGQFSTVLRHYYLNDLIDSTISTYYYKKCIDKPLASNPKVKLSSKMTDFPFRYNFNCSEELPLEKANQIKMKNWFSFIFSSANIPAKPDHDFYFDFDFTDGYNFLLNFSEPVELKNAAAFIKKINNDYFELESEIIKNTEKAYLLKVKLAVKRTSIPEGDAQLLMDLVKELDELNDFTLLFEKRS